MSSKTSSPPTATPPENNPRPFPNLNLDALVEQAHRWGANHDSIERIILYLNGSWPGQDQSLPRYTLAVEIREDEGVKSLNELKRENPQAMREIRDAFRELRVERNEERKRNPEAPTDHRPLGTFFLQERSGSLSPKAVEILEKTEEVSVSPWFQAMNEFQPDNIRFVTGDSFPSEVIKPAHLALLEAENRKHKKDKIYWWDEWVIYPCSPGEMPEDVSTMYSWLLYRKHYETEATDPEKSPAPDTEERQLWAAKEMLPKIAELWSQILAGRDEPLKLRTADDLQKCAFDILRDDPVKWSPINGRHLEDLSLYNPAPERAARTFREGLLRLVLKTQGFSVKNIRKLVQSL